MLEQHTREALFARLFAEKRLPPGFWERADSLPGEAFNLFGHSQEGYDSAVGWITDQLEENELQQIARSFATVLLEWHLAIHVEAGLVERTNDGYQHTQLSSEVSAEVHDQLCLEAESRLRAQSQESPKSEE